MRTLKTLALALVVILALPLILCAALWFWVTSLGHLEEGELEAMQ